MSVRYIPSGDSAFILRFGTVISIDINHKIRSLIMLLSDKLPHGILEFIPSYTDLLVTYNPLIIHYKEVLSFLKENVSKLDTIQIEEARTVEIPVCYGGEFGEDLEVVKAETMLSENEIINKHSKPSYLVYMLGFTPGFCYLGGMDNRIATPRKKIPSQIIKAGSVGIAANQTGIYPIDSPGGWQIIGRTPLKMFDANRENKFLVKAGDYIKFKPISNLEYYNILETNRINGIN